MSVVGKPLLLKSSAFGRVKAFQFLELCCKVDQTIGKRGWIPFHRSRSCFQEEQESHGSRAKKGRDSDSWRGRQTWVQVSCCAQFNNRSKRWVTCHRQRFKRQPLSFTAAMSLAPMAPAIDLDVHVSLNKLEQSKQWSSIATTKKILSKFIQEKWSCNAVIVRRFNRGHANRDESMRGRVAQTGQGKKETWEKRHCLQLVEKKR